jgi:two-component system phosphate regulon response regulator PhoB
MENRPLVLVADDQPEITKLVSLSLQNEGFRVLTASDGPSALEHLSESNPDVLLLDIMMPGMSGIEVLREVREHHPVPVIMLTARGAAAQVSEGLNLGADDYVVKPFSPSELVARLRAVIRRAQPSVGEEVLRYADIAMDLVAHRVSRAGSLIHLGPTEFRLLRHFLENPARVFSREQLLDRVWGHETEIEMRTVDVHIRRLRKALNHNGGRDLLRTVRSVGYALDRAT